MTEEEIKEYVRCNQFRGVIFYKMPEEVKKWVRENIDKYNDPYQRICFFKSGKWNEFSGDETNFDDYAVAIIEKEYMELYYDSKANKTGDIECPNCGIKIDIDWLDKQKGVCLCNECGQYLKIEKLSGERCVSCKYYRESRYYKDEVESPCSIGSCENERGIRGRVYPWAYCFLYERKHGR